MFPVVVVLGALAYLGALCLAISALLGPLFVRVPYVPTQDAILPDIIAAMELSDGSTVFDLGSGDGRVLRYASKRTPAARYVGIERAPFPLAIAWLMSLPPRLTGGRRIRYIRGSFLDQDLSDATHVFTYLAPDAMDALLPKFERELQPGTRLVSSDFGFMNRPPTRVIDLHRTDHRGRRLLAYEF